MKTWLCAIGAALLLALALAGCRQEGNDPPPGGTGEQQETAAQSDALRGMLRGRLGELQLVRSDTMNSGEVSIVLAFRQAAQDAAGEELKLVTDFEYAYPVQAFELVIGSTGREGTHFSLPQGEALPAGAYRVDIVEQRVILSYSDRDGMKNGLEYLLLAMVEADESALKSSFADALLERGLRRYDSFVLSNAFVDGMKLPASADTPCIGLSDPGSTVSALLYDGETLLREVTAQTDADGTWSLSLPAETEADRLLFAVNGANSSRPSSRWSLTETRPTACSSFSTGTTPSRFRSPGRVCCIFRPANIIMRRISCSPSIRPCILPRARCCMPALKQREPKTSPFSAGGSLTPTHFRWKPGCSTLPSAKISRCGIFR